MKKIFISGATGFIGSYFLDLALNSNLEVLALRRNEISRPKIQIKKEPKWVTKNILALEANDFKNCDVFAHFAFAGVVPQKVNFEEMIRDNLISTLKALECAANSGVKRIILAGSCHEYGCIKLDEQPIKADARLNPLNSYGFLKAAIYVLAKDICKKHNLELFYGRIFSAFGEGQFNRNFWPSLKDAALKGQDFRMTEGNQILDFIRVEEVAQEFLDATLRNDLKSGKVCIKNIGTGKATKLVDFAMNEWSRLNATGKLLPGQLNSLTDKICNYIPDLEEKFL